jgi:hypothetical protein
MNKYEYNEALSNLKDGFKEAHGRWLKEESLIDYDKERIKKITNVYFQFKSKADHLYRKTFISSTLILSIILILDNDISIETLLLVFGMAVIFSFIAYGVKIKDVKKPPRVFRKITSRNNKSKIKAYASFVAGIVFTLLSIGYAMDGSRDLTPYSVSVDSYTRSDGTKVQAHNRRPPGSVDRDRGFNNQQALGIFGSIAGGFIILISAFSVLDEKE